MRLLARLSLPLATALLLATLAPPAAQAQTTLDRPPLLDAAWAGLPWSLQVSPTFRFRGAEEAAGTGLVATLEAALGLPGGRLVGARFAPHSPVVPGAPDEWEIFARSVLLEEQRGAPLDLFFQGSMNTAAGGGDAEISAARWLGPLRLVGTGRLLGDAFGTGRTRGVLGAGAVLFPSPRNLPISLAASAAAPMGLEEGERVAWGAALNVGVSFSPHTLSLFATNSGSGTVQGTSRGEPGVRLGIAFTAPVPVGQLFGLVVPRERAREAVVEDAPEVARPVAASIFRYLFVQDRIEVEAGTTIEWTNLDAMVHTVTADDGSWNSGAIPPGESWRARFDEPGIYPFHCGPHPFMQGVVVVR